MLISDPFEGIFQVMCLVPKEGKPWLKLYEALKSLFETEMLKHPEWVWTVIQPPPRPDLLDLLDEREEFYACGDFRLQLSSEGVVQCIGKDKITSYLYRPTAFFASLPDKKPEALQKLHNEALAILQPYGEVGVEGLSPVSRLSIFCVMLGTDQIQLLYYHESKTWDAVLFLGSQELWANRNASAAEAWEALVAQKEVSEYLHRVSPPMSTETNPEELIQVEFDLDDEVYDRLCIQAEKESISVAQLIERILRETLTQEV